MTDLTDYLAQVRERHDAARDVGKDGYLPSIDIIKVLGKSCADVETLAAMVGRVLEVHRPDERGECQECPDKADAHWRAKWPCATVAALQEVNGDA